MGVFPCSSMVEQEAVNFEVAGSSPVPGATMKALRAFFSAPKSGLGLRLRRRDEPSPGSLVATKKTAPCWSGF